MPKEISVTRRWTITEYKVIVPPNDFSSNGSVIVTGTIEVIDQDSHVLAAQGFTYTISGVDNLGANKLDALLNMVATSSIANVQAGMTGPEAYYAATKEALYGRLQTDGIIPLAAS